MKGLYPWPITSAPCWISRIVSKSRYDNESIHRLKQALVYDFVTKPELLTRALTHRSHSTENYERLEFLGDSLLGFIIADEIYDRFPNADEGLLSRLRASVVRQETLADLCSELDLRK